MFSDAQIAISMEPKNAPPFTVEGQIQALFPAFAQSSHFKGSLLENLFEQDGEPAYLQGFESRTFLQLLEIYGGQDIFGGRDIFAYLQKIGMDRVLEIIRIENFLCIPAPNHAYDFLSQLISSCSTAVDIRKLSNPIKSQLSLTAKLAACTSKITTDKYFPLGVAQNKKGDYKFALCPAISPNMHTTVVPTSAFRCVGWVDNFSLFCGATTLIFNTPQDSWLCQQMLNKLENIKSEMPLLNSVVVDKQSAFAD